MADASLTTADVRRTVFGNVRIVVADVTFAGNYRTGGVALKPSTLGLQTIDFLDISPVALADGGTNGGVAAKYDYTNQKIQMFEAAASGSPLLEKTDNEAFADASTTKVRVLAVGI